MPKRSTRRLVGYWMDRCAWCRSKIGEENERIAVKMRFQDRKDY
jgi:hypothetical protein